MAGRAKLAMAVLAVTSASAFGQSLVTERFDTSFSDTNGHWEQVGNTTSPQNYDWKSTDNTGTTVQPPVGTASAGGELGGFFYRRPTVNYYAFDVGNLNPDNYDVEAHGVFRVVTRNSGGAFQLGFFNENNFSSNYMGIYFDDGIVPYTMPGGTEIEGADIEDPGGNGPGEVVPFSIEWNNTANTVTYSVGESGPVTEGGNFSIFTHFGVSGAVDDPGGDVQVYLDDLSFTSNNAIPVPVPTWNVDASGNWSTPSNWTNNTVPNAIGAVASFGDKITHPRTVTVDSAKTVGTINFDNTKRYTIGGASTLTVQGAGSAINVNLGVNKGRHTISAPIAFNSNTTLQVEQGPGAVVDHFNGPTPGSDAYWDELGNREPFQGQDYGWSDTDFTGTSVNPPNGTASGAGEIGGMITRSSVQNHYGFDIGGLDAATTAFEASGVLRLISRGGGSGYDLGFFNETTSWPTGFEEADAVNFIGFSFDDGHKTSPIISNENQSIDGYAGFDPMTDDGIEDPNPEGGPQPQPTVPFSLSWDPADGGSLVATIGSGTRTVEYTGGLSNFDLFTHFGIMSIAADGGSLEVYFDDFTFTSNNAFGSQPADLTLSGNMSSSGGAILTKTGAGKVAVKHLRAGGLSITQGIVEVLPNGTSSGTSRVSSLSITAGTTLDLTDNDLIVDGGDYSAIEADVIEGFNNGDWMGTGITSSAAANDTAFISALGIIDNGEFGYTEFSGQTGLNSDEILVKYTYYGDADVGGTVNNDDFVQFLAGYSEGAEAKWLNGDFDYNSSVNLDDFALFLAGLQGQGDPRISPELFANLSEFVAAEGVDVDLSAIPEPSAIGLIGLAASGVMFRRRRAR